MCRAAALTVRKVVRAAASTGAEVVDRHLGERDPVSVRVCDHVEGDVDGTGIRGHGIGMLIDGLLVESFQLRRLGRAPADRISSATASSLA